MGMFDPIQRSAGIQQAFDNLSSQLNFAPKPTFDMNDPASIKKYAQTLMQEGKTEEAMKYNQMAQELEAKQAQQADQNVARAYESVRGTAQEDQFKAAMRQAGKGHIIQDIDDKNTQRRIRDIQLDNAEDDVAATAAYDDYLRSLNAGDQEGMKLVRDMAIADGSSEKIDAYISKKKQEKQQEVTAKAAQLRVQEAERQTKANAIPLPKSPEEYNVRLKQAQSQGVEDLYARRWQTYNDMRKDHEAWKQGEDWSQHKYSKEEIEAAGLNYNGYIATHQTNPKLANDQAADALLKAKSTSGSSPKIADITRVKHYEEILPDYLSGKDSTLWFDTGPARWFDENKAPAAKFAADIDKNGGSVETAIRWVEDVAKDPTIIDYDVDKDGNILITRPEGEEDITRAYTQDEEYIPFKDMQNG